MKLSLTFDKGLNADALPSELGEGFVSDCLEMRFRKGFAEVVGRQADRSQDFNGTSGRIFQLYTSAATYVVGSTGSMAAVHTVGGGVVSPTEITRKTEGAVISNATAAGTTVTITTATNHGLSTGNTISVWGFTPSTYNAESVSITVTSVTVFTYTVASAPAVSPATAFGMYSVDASTSNTAFTTGGELNGVLLLNSPTAGCYYWGGSTSTPVRKIVGSYTARVGLPFKNFVVQLAPTISSVEYPFRICWSDAVEAGAVPHNDFTAAATNQAGDVDKPEIGELVGALPLGDDLIVYGTSGRLVMRYIGGNDVFSFTALPGNEGLYSDTTVVNTPIGHVFVDRSSHIRIHSGGVSRDVSEGRVQSILGEEGAQIPWIVCNERQREIWIAYLAPPATSGFSSFCLIWNWEEETWGRVTVSQQCHAILVRTNDLATNLAVYSFGGTTKMALDELDTIDQMAGTFSLERAGIDAGDSDLVKHLQRSRWNIENVFGSGAAFTVQHGASMFAASDPTYATGVTYTPGTTDYVNKRATGGKYLAVKLSGTNTGSFTTSPYYKNRIRTAELEYTAGGRR